MPTQYCATLVSPFATYRGEAVQDLHEIMLLEQLFTGKIRLKLMMRLFLNPSTRVFLRGLEREFDVSSNTVRLELAKLREMKLIREYSNEENAKVKEYGVNRHHPMFRSLRNIILQYAGLDQIVEHILEKLGNVEQVLLTGELADGKNSHFVDLIIVGNIDKVYMVRLIEKVEDLVNKKIRIATFLPEEFHKDQLSGVGTVMELYG